MQHGTRKRSRRAPARALGLGLAIALVLPSGAALANGGMPDGESRMVGGGAVGGGSVGGDDEGAIDHVEKPFGQIIRIIPGVGMSALLYLPALPVDPYYRDEETGHPALQTLCIERAYADDPQTWERWGTFEWDEDWQEYASGSDSVFPVYDDDYQDPSILYCTVSYSSDTVDYRDFYLRATAVVRENGATTTIEFEPALFVYEQQWIPAPKPDPDPEPDPSPEDPDEPAEAPPTVVNPPKVDAGDGGGNRGGVGQGESDRPKPEQPSEEPEPSTENLPVSGGDPEPSTEKPDAVTLRGEIGAGQGPASGNDALEREDDAGGGATGTQGSTPGESADGARAATSAARDGGSSSDEPADAAPDVPASSEERIPGFVWAVGATVGAVAVAGGIVAALRARPRRPRS